MTERLGRLVGWRGDRDRSARLPNMRQNDAISMRRTKFVCQLAKGCQAFLSAQTEVAFLVREAFLSPGSHFDRLRHRPDIHSAAPPDLSPPAKPHGANTTPLS